MNTAAIADRYEIVRPLGAGSEAGVWLASERTGGGLVALKYLRATPGVTGLRELANVLELRHPGIVALRDFSYLPGGDCFLVYDYIAGGTLREWLEPRGAVPPRQALTFACDLLLALDYLHTRGFVHCDLKPENILLALGEAGEPPQAKLADFGLARRLAAHRPNEAIAGSPAYMAPERFRNEMHAGSDLYAIGVMLFEMLAGRRPFEGDNQGIARAHLQQPVPALPDHLAPDVAALAGQLLAKDASNRPASAAAALRLVRRALGAPERQPGSLPARERPRFRAGPPRAFSATSTLTMIGRCVIAADLQRMHLLDAGHRAWLALDLGSHCEFADAATGRDLRFTLPKLGPALQVMPDSTLVHTGQGEFLRWSRGARAPALLAGGAQRVRSLALSPDGGRLAWQSGAHIHVQRLGPDGDAAAGAWALPECSLGLTRHLAWLPCGLLAVATGPLRPHVQLFGVGGPLTGVITLPGPLMEGPVSGGLAAWIALDHQRPQTPAVIAREPDGRLHRWHLPPGLVSIAPAATHVLTLDAEGALDAWTAAGERLPQGTFPDRPAGILVSPSQRFLCTWRPAASGTAFTLYELSL